MKTIYKFKLEKEVEVEEPQMSTVDGKEVKTLVKIKKKEPYAYFIQYLTSIIFAFLNENN